MQYEIFVELCNRRAVTCLAILHKLHTRLAAVSSSKAKREELETFRNSLEYACDKNYFDKYLNYIYNGDITFGVTSSKVKSFSKKNADGIGYVDPVTLLDDLSRRELTGDTALVSLRFFIECVEVEFGKEAADMFCMILDKDFKCGVNVKTVSKVFPIKLPFAGYVALSNKYFDREGKVDFTKDRWFCSRKLDGNRLILIKRGDTVTCWSRQGKEVKTLGRLKDVISKVPGDFVLDGEVCIIDENGDEDFQKIMKEITRKNHTVANPVMKVFDILSEEEFHGEAVSAPFGERYLKLKGFFETYGETLGGRFGLVEQEPVSSRDDLTAKFETSKELGWEGLMLRKDVPYECGRTNNLLKVKCFLDNEYVITGYEMGPMRFVEDGRQVEKEVLSSVTIMHKGCEVSVGSGFSKEQREWLHDHPDEIRGSIVKVRYFEETGNIRGDVSLRFPTVVYFYGKNGRFD